MSVHLTSTKKLKVISLHQEGYGSRFISHKLSISEAHLKRLINRYRHYGKSGLERLPTMQFSSLFKQEVVERVLKKCLSCEQVALHYNINPTSVYKWVCQVKAGGYASLSIVKPKGRPPKIMGRAKKLQPQTELEK